MAKHSMTEVIATRQMKRVLPDGRVMPVHVRIGLPVRRTSRAGEDWACPFQVTGLGDDTILAGIGEDGIQALYHALQIAGVHIATSAFASELDWSDMPNFGFPKVPA